MLLERTSTLALQNIAHSSMRRLQVDLESAQVEVATGRHADAGLVLGGGVSRNINWRAEIARIETLSKRLEITGNRADVMQATIDSLKAQTENLRDVMISARSATNGPALGKAAGENTLSGLLSALSTSYGGDFIFSGRSPDKQPLQSYVGMAPQAAFDAAFVAEFGFAKSSPLAADIAPSQMQSFIDGRFSDLFENPAWSTDWSTADPENMKVRLENGSSVTSDANVNEVGFRSVVKAAVLAFELGGTAIGQGTFQTVVDSVATESSRAIDQLGEIQARIGHAQKAIAQNGSRLVIKKNMLETSILKTEGVSEYDAAVRINTLMTQLESSYAVTSRISKLSLLSYI